MMNKEIAETRVRLLGAQAFPDEQDTRSPGPDKGRNTFLKSLSGARKAMAAVVAN